MVKNMETGSLSSGVGSAEYCRGVAAQFNADYQTDAFEVVRWSDEPWLGPVETELA